MSIRERMELLRAMSNEEKEAFFRKRATTSREIRYRLHKSIREFERQEKARKAKTKLLIAALFSFCISLSSLLIISYLYLN